MTRRPPTPAAGRLGKPPTGARREAASRRSGGCWSGSWRRHHLTVAPPLQATPSQAKTTRRHAAMASTSLGDRFDLAASPSTTRSPFPTSDACTPASIPAAPVLLRPPRLLLQSPGELADLKSLSSPLISLWVVESVGEHVEGFAAGDSVVPTFLSQCSDCADCTSSRNNVCSKYRFAVRPGMPRDDTTRFRDADGSPLHHFLGVSSFSEYTVVDVTQVVKVDPAVPPPTACLLSCGATTGVGAAWKLAKVEPGSLVAIFGLGAVGLAVAEGARICGASKIIGVDLNPEKHELGKKFGLTHFINPKELGEKTVRQAIIELTDGGADYCFECIGLATLMSEAFQSSRAGWGKTIILGVEMHGAPFSIPSREILHGKCVMGSLFGGVKPKQDIPILAKKYLNKELELDKFVTHEVAFKDINTAFDLLLQGKSLRCTIWMDK